jgi:adenine-specific DNA-methyltransferase
MANLNFKGKAFVQNYHLTVKFHQLIPKKDKSLTKKVSLHDNLIIHGDNLKALKALLPTYAGQVKCIYIDPPYNTGNENWVYNDNVSSPMMQEWLGKVVDKEDLTRHDKWLCMMMPRLKLLKELLSNDGVIFIHIDNNEVNHLISLMNEIFSENNLVGILIWRKKEGGGQAKTYFITEHEYILVYRKSEDFIWQDETIPKNEKDYKREDKDGKFTIVKLSKWGNTARRQDRPKMYFPLIAPDGKKVFPKSPDGNDGRWRVGKKTMEELLEDNLIYWERKNGEWIPYEKIYYDKNEVKIIKERSILYEIASTGDASKMLTEIFGKKDAFENPKPVEIAEFCLEYTTTNDSIVLDSFAGSGTTGHAVLRLNRGDIGNRKFILVQCDELDNSKNKISNICDKITAERIRRVIKSIPKAKDERLKEKLDGTFSYFELGDPIEMESILEGNKFPSYNELARYVFYTATGEEFDEKQLDEKRNFIGESREYLVYLFYKPDTDYLKATALTLDRANALGPYKNKRRLVFAPTKYLDQDHLDQLRIDFAQLPFEIYKLVR